MSWFLSDRHFLGPPGQYHGIFSIYIEDIFQRNTTKPTIVLLRTNLIFQKKIQQNNFPKKKSQKKIVSKNGTLYTKFGFIRHTPSISSVHVISIQCGAPRYVIFRNHDNIVIFKYLMKFTHIFTCISARKM